ncbi:erythromycin esterase family protein [Streptomyces sp. NPDC086080]|uniref:erythromycin esterase family protein n=1 Tax=Streptomyces sp. NPDC086080 TaxID=3365748 RepID=UPI0037CFCFA7
MPSWPRSPRRLGAAVLAPLLVLLITAGGPPSPEAETGSPARGVDPAVVATLTRAATPLLTTEAAGPSTDLRPFSRSVGAARLVGLGEGSHGSHEFFTLHDRLFRHLVENKGFATYSREAGWNAGLDVNEWVQGGPGDIREIIQRNFQSDWVLFATEEYAQLFEWMRAYNARHDHRHKLQYMGFDVGPIEPALYDKVLAYVAKHYPDLEQRFTELYSGHPTGSVQAATTEFRHRPPAERQDLARRAQEAYELLAAQRPAPDPIDLHSTASIAQSTRFYAYPDTEQGETDSLQFRDRTMAENVAWWHRLTGDKMVVSAHNSHVAHRDTYPSFTRQGGFLRQWFGRDYTNLRTAFHQGSFDSTYETAAGGVGVRAFTVGPPEPGFNEYTLGAVPYDRYFLDLRTLPSPAGQWAAQAHPNRFFGGFWEPTDVEDIALSKYSDMLIFVRRSTAAQMVPAAS